MMIFQKRPG